MVNSLPGYDQPYGAPPTTAWQGGQPLGLPEAATRGMLSRRLVAYGLDIVFILGFTALLSIAIAILGLVTFGFGWSLFAVLPASGVLYSVITVGGAKQSTVGMRMAGLRVVRTQGGPVDWLTAGSHALLFYVAIGTFVLWLVDIGLGVVRGDRRMGHDLLVGLAVVRA